MAFSIKVLPLARLEIIEARDWYAARSRRLGEDFITELDRQMHRIADNPLAFPEMLPEARRARLRRFPYSLFFRINWDACFVIACFHASRDPNAWRERT